MNVSISQSNSKMGNIPSVSLPAVLTCRPDAPCFKKCYARKIERLRPNVHNAYENNYNILINNPDIYFREVEAAIMMSRFFRWHVSGDIPNREYLDRMVEISKRNQHCEQVCFTKRYDIVNSYIKDHGSIPSNLHMIFSVWKGLTLDNPYNLPEAHIQFKDGTTTARPDAFKCEGNCSLCAIEKTKCYALKSGEQIVLNEH